MESMCHGLYTSQLLRLYMHTYCTSLHPNLFFLILHPVRNVCVCVCVCVCVISASDVLDGVTVISVVLTGVTLC